MDESAKGKKNQRLRHFGEIVDWCHSNGFSDSDFDFDGLERRVLELAEAMEGQRAPAPKKPAGRPKDAGGHLVPFRKKLLKRTT